jgi:IS1 family transposase
MNNINNMSNATYTTQNDLLLNNLMEFYKKDDNLNKMLNIITGESKISLRIVDWFATNYAKKNFTLYNIESANGACRRFKVYVDYKLKLKAYSKQRFDPFCRWDRINIPYKDGTFIETTIGQLNFFKWSLENKVIQYIEDNYETIEKDMNNRNSTSKRKENLVEGTNTKTRKKREELSVSATKSIKKEKVEIVVNFN